MPSDRSLSWQNPPERISRVCFFLMKKGRRDPDRITAPADSRSYGGRRSSADLISAILLFSACSPSVYGEKNRCPCC